MNNNVLSLRWKRRLVKLNLSSNNRAVNGLIARSSSNNHRHNKIVRHRTRASRKSRHAIKVMTTTMMIAAVRCSVSAAMT